MGGERANHTLQPTALVNEAFLRLAESSPIAIEDRVHFLRLAARTMRHILVDHARKKGAARHGGMMTRVTLTDDITGVSPTFDLLALDEALGKLEKLSERQATTIEMRFIVGLNVDEVARELGVSERTVKGDTRVAMAWLRRELVA
jgi:RNA polymerase sigma factor (TIGR02999 family)